MDVRFGVRMLRKNPGFAAVAIVTLALGIAANTTIFSVMNGWMFRPPNIKDPGRVVMILSTNPAKGLGWDQNPVSVLIDEPAKDPSELGGKSPPAENPVSAFLGGSCK